MESVPIQYLINSDECELLNNLLRLDSNTDSKSEIFFKTNIFDKLFTQIDPLNSNSFFLQNKYLYYLSSGALAYLEAMDTMRVLGDKSEEYEINAVTKVIKDKISNYTNYDFVSLGCGNGHKDFSIVNNLENYKPMYIPIDVSPHFLQLSIKHFISNSLRSNKAAYDYKKIRPINCDFFNFSETLVIGEDKPKIYTCLGNTIGNYQENGLLKNFHKIMKKNDFLIVSFDLYQSENEFEKHINRYLNHSCMDFLINPLKLIPKYKGLLNKTKYFNIYSEKDKHQKKISNIDGGLSVVPTFYIPYNDQSVFVCWSTKYLMDKVGIFFKNHDLFEFVHGREEGEDKYVVLLKIKEDNIKKKKAIKILNELLKEEPDESNNIELITEYIKSDKASAEDIDIIIEKSSYSIIRPNFKKKSIGIR